MRSGRGLQAEVLASLALVMLTAAVVVVALVVEAHRTQIATLERLAARTLQDDAGRPHPLTGVAVPELRWWRVVDGADVQPLGGHGDTLDAESLALATAAGAGGRVLVQTALPWQPTRFAVPRAGEVRIARLPPAVSGGWLLGLVAVEVCVFTGFGLLLLRRRLVEPLERLGAAARAIADGDFGVRVQAEGPRETAAVAGAFNAMTEALATRTEALEKAVADLRRSNRELGEAREGLDRAERLAAVGQLAAGVAHEVGNPMGAVLAFLDVARRDPGLTDAGREPIERALQAGSRVRTILRQLLDFSRPPRREPAVVDVGAVARETAALFSAQQRYAGHELQVQVAEGTPAALADRGQVAQILLNLLINAGDACAGSDAPRIEVSVRGGALRTRRSAGQGSDSARRTPDGVVCRVADDGPGVEPGDRERIFDPFFTTKPPGEGTGLGLSNAQRLAEQLGGSLTLEEPGAGGAAFVLRLPSAVPPHPSGAVRR